MMGSMLILVMIFAVALALAAAAGAYVFATRQAEANVAARTAEREAELAANSESVQQAIAAAVTSAVADAQRRATEERDAAVKAALEQSAIFQTQHLDATVRQHNESLQATASQVKEQTTAELGSKKDVIDARLEQVHGEMRAELAKVASMLTALGEASAEKFGQVESSIQAHMQVANSLSESTQALRSALANPQARGQWGERMAEDVLRMCGFVEHINYSKQAQIDGGTGRPDYTFHMPKGQTLFMDVKFPMAAYLRYLEAGTDAERETHLKRFLLDVRARVKELAKREYAIEGGGSALDNVLLFIPNEQLTGFIHEHDPSLIEDAMGQQIVMCSPMTLFAFLGVIRQAHDNFTIERTSDEILSLIGKFGTQWTKYADQMEKIKRRFEGVEKDFEALTGTRRRALERPLRDLDAIRQERGLPVDGELFALTGDDADETPPGGEVRHLGA
jgi:DNA recombination protein RmuC